MTNFSRIAVAAALIAGLGGIAHAQPQFQPPQPVPGHDYALSEGRSAVVDRTVGMSGVVPASESQTIMGLRVPR